MWSYLGAVAQVVQPERRSTAFGVVTAAGSFGTFALVPAVQWLILHRGWQGAFPVIAILVGVILLLAFALPRRAGAPAGASNADGTKLEALYKARRHSSYLAKQKYSVEFRSLVCRYDQVSVPTQDRGWP